MNVMCLSQELLLQTALKRGMNPIPVHAVQIKHIWLKQIYIKPFITLSQVPLVSNNVIFFNLRYLFARNTGNVAVSVKYTVSGTPDNKTSAFFAGKYSHGFAETYCFCFSHKFSSKCFRNSWTLSTWSVQPLSSVNR